MTEPTTTPPPPPLESPASSRWRRSLEWMRAHPKVAAVTAGVVFVAAVAGASGSDETEPVAADDTTTTAVATTTTADDNDDIDAAYAAVPELAGVLDKPDFAVSVVLACGAEWSTFDREAAELWLGVEVLRLQGSDVNPGRTLEPAVYGKALGVAMSKRCPDAGQEAIAAIEREPAPTTTTTAAPTTTTTARQPRGITADEYESIQNGWSVEQVLPLCDGTESEMSNYESGGYASVVYGCDGHGSSGANAVFQFSNDGPGTPLKLIGKSQFGIR